MNFPSSITNDTILRGCYELTDLDCIDSYLQYINVDEDKNCYAQCPLECTEILIDLKPSYSNYPTEWYSSVLLNNSAFIAMVAKTATANFTPYISFLRANTLLLNVYYDQMSYAKTEEAPAMTIDTLIAVFGGNMGVFLILNFI